MRLISSQKVLAGFAAFAFVCLVSSCGFKMRSKGASEIISSGGATGSEEGSGSGRNVVRNPVYNSSNNTVSWSEEPDVSSYQVVIRELPSGLTVWGPTYVYATTLDLKKIPAEVPPGKSYRLSVAAPSQNLESIEFEVPPGETWQPRRNPVYDSAQNTVSWTAEPGVGSYQVVIRELPSAVRVWGPYYVYSTTLDLKKIPSEVPPGKAYRFSVAAPSQPLESIEFSIP